VSLPHRLPDLREKAVGYLDGGPHMPKHIARCAAVRRTAKAHDRDGSESEEDPNDLLDTTQGPGRDGTTRSQEPFARDRPDLVAENRRREVEPPSGGSMTTCEGIERIVEVMGSTLTSSEGPELNVSTEKTRTGRVPRCSRPSVGLRS